MRFAPYCALMGVALSGGSALAQTTAWLDSSARLELKPSPLQLEPTLFNASWQRATPRFDSSAAAPEPGKPIPFAINVPCDGGAVRGVATFTPLPHDGVKCRYEFTPERDVQLNMLGVSCGMPVNVLVGRHWRTDSGEAGNFPQHLNGPTIYAAKPTRWLEFSTEHGGLNFLLPEGMSLLLQDDRQWSGQTFTLRIGFNGMPNDFKAGETHVVEFTLLAGPSLVLKADAPIVLQAGAEWAPLNVDLEIEPGSALDFSTQGWHDAPAGKHGYVVAKGPRFEFENLPGKPQRFYGVNLCFSANVPDPELSERVAERLMRLGYNTVRIHHHERDLVRGSPDSVTLNPEAMAKFDALMAAFIKRGIYLTTDLYVSRNVPWREIGEDQDGNVPMDLFKSLIYVHPGAKENHKKFLTNFLMHVNPHTGRSYAKEPALSWLAMINEGNFSNFPANFERPEWRAAWSEWITKKRGANPAFADIPDTLPPNFWSGDEHLAASFTVNTADGAMLYEIVRD